MQDASSTPEMVDGERLDRVAARLNRDIECGYIHGASMRVSLNGEVIVNFVGGYADKTNGRLVQKDSVFVTMSTAKLFTAVLALSLVERGLLRLHTPVADLIPEFGRFGKETINLFHLLTHTSGLPSSFNPGPEDLVNIERLTSAVCNVPIECRPGEKVSYSYLVAHSIIAAMCLKVDGRGRNYSTMLQDDLFDPLNMTETSLGPRDDLLPRLCPVRSASDSPYDLLPAPMIEGLGQLFLQPGSEIPAGGCLTTIDDLHRFTEMLRRGGKLGDTRILSPATIKFCAQNFVGDKRNAVWDPILSSRHWNAFPDNIGIGFRVRGAGIAPGPFGVLNSPGTFGHFGAGSTGSWIDPDKKLAFSLLTTGLLEESHNLERTAILSDLVVSALTI